MLEKLLSPRIALTVTRWAIVRRVDIEPQRLSRITPSGSWTRR